MDVRAQPSGSAVTRSFAKDGGTMCRCSSSSRPTTSLHLFADPFLEERPALDPRSHYSSALFGECASLARQPFQHKAKGQPQGAEQGTRGH